MNQQEIMAHPCVARFAKVPKQTLLTEEGKQGDCWRCCVAAILGMAAADVPHFLEQSLQEDAPSMHSVTQRWLYEQGYWLVQSATRPYAMHVHGDNILVPPMIVSGPTVRSKRPEDHHAVVMYGGTLIYDPHPSNAGLLAELNFALVVPHLPGVYPKVIEEVL